MSMAIYMMKAGPKAPDLGMIREAFRLGADAGDVPEAGDELLLKLRSEHRRRIVDALAGTVAADAHLA